MTDKKSSASDLFGFDINELSGILKDVNEKSQKLWRLLSQCVRSVMPPG